MQTYQDAINALLKESIMLPPELIAETQSFIEENRQFGFTNKEDFIRDAIRQSLKLHKSGNESVEIPREQYQELNEAVREMGTPFRSAEQFINSQINEVLEEYEEYRKAHKAQD